MGCSESSNVAQATKKVQRVQQLENSTLMVKKGQEKMHYLLGHISEHDQLFAKVNLTNRTINRLSIPQGFQPMNFSSMLEIDNKHFLISGGINNSMNHISSDSYMYDSSDHSMRTTGKMNQARYTHAAILFGGDVYAIGGRYFGEDEQAILQSCQRYSISDNKWYVLASLNVKRCTCFAIQWKNSIYVLGGYTGVFQRSQKVEKYNEKKDKWDILPFQLNRGIQSSFACSNKPNQLLFLGGNTNSGPTASVISLNLHEQTVQSHKKLKQQKTLHKSFVFNYEIFIFGGSQKLNLQVYNLLNEKSQLIDIKLSQQFTHENFEILTMSQKSLKVQYFEQKITNVSSSEEDQIVILFGTTDEPFILQINVSIPSCTFHAVPLGLKLFANSGGVNINKLSYLLFGGIEDDSLSCVSSDVYYYNHSTKEVKKMASMITQRYAFTYLQIQSKIYAIGGGNSDIDGNLNILQACEYYSIEQNSWKSIANLPVSLISSLSLEFKNALYVFGGILEGDQRNKSIFKYNHVEDSWSELLFHLPFGIQSAFIYQYKPSEFYIFGGRIDNGDSDGIWSLIFAQNSSSQCSFYQKGKTSEKKSGLKVFKPKQQNFFVSLGGQKHIINYYDADTLKILNEDGLRKLNDVFLEQVSTLNSYSMQKYLSICKQK